MALALFSLPAACAALLASSAADSAGFELLGTGDSITSLGVGTASALIVTSPRCAAGGGWLLDRVGEGRCIGGEGASSLAG